MDRGEIRLYTFFGEKRFAPFDAEAFLDDLTGRLVGLPDGACVNGVIERALSVATGNADDCGRPFPLMRFEFSPRDPATGLVLPLTEEEIEYLAKEDEG